MNSRIQHLQFAIDTKDPNTFEDALSLICAEPIDEIIINKLNEALEYDWHYRHEDIVGILQDAKNPSSIDALKKTITKQFDYLSYDDGYGLARKCIWALSDIGTKEAREILEITSRIANRIIAGYAQKRLDRWDYELPRKRI